MDTDPYPDSVGIYINSYVTPDVCQESTDTDYDGFADFCEERVAAAFAPVLFYTSGDDITGVPRYALRPLGDGRVLILYMLSMYLDLGDGSCYTPPPFTGDPCAGHAGDSEVIALTVRYEPTFEHWVLDEALYSQHTNYAPYAATGAAPNRYVTALPYYGQVGGKPLAYVARHKHALYESDSACDSGGLLNADDCNSNSYQYVSAAWSQNIGSRNYKYSNCVYSANPVFQNGIQECHWTAARFTG